MKNVAELLAKAGIKVTSENTIEARDLDRAIEVLAEMPQSEAYERLVDWIDSYPEESVTELQKGSCAKDAKKIEDMALKMTDIVNHEMKRPEASAALKDLPMGKRYPNAKNKLTPEDEAKLGELYKKRDAAGVQNGSPEYNKLQKEIDEIQG